jgi:hypothetical protein
MKLEYELIDDSQLDVPTSNASSPMPPNSTAALKNSRRKNLPPR